VYYRDRRRSRSPANAHPARNTVAGSGTGARKPRISPPGNCVEWTFRYAIPEANPAVSAASADAGVPPFAVTNAGLYVAAESRSKVWLYEPEVTPSGNPGKVGTVVAMPVASGGKRSSGCAMPSCRS
jgi:hypothetical protein